MIFAGFSPHAEKQKSPANDRGLILQGTHPDGFISGMRKEYPGHLRGCDDGYGGGAQTLNS